MYKDLEAHEIAIPSWGTTTHSMSQCRMSIDETIGKPR